MSRYGWTHAPDEHVRFRDMTGRERLDVTLVILGILALLLAGSSAGGPS